MARINTNPDALRAVAVPSGTYASRITKIEQGRWKGFSGEEEDKLMWCFRIEEAEDASLVGKVLNEFTSMAEGQGDQYMSFVRALGFDPADWDTDEAVDREVMIKVKLNAGKDKAGQPRFYENVVAIALV